MSDESLNVPVQGAGLPIETQCGLFADIMPPKFTEGCIARLQRPGALVAVKTYRLPFGAMVGLLDVSMAPNRRTTSVPRGMKLIADIVPPDFGDDGCDVIFQRLDLSMVGVPVAVMAGAILLEIIPEAAVHVRAEVERQYLAHVAAMQRLAQNAVGRRG